MMPKPGERWMTEKGGVVTLREDRGGDLCSVETVRGWFGYWNPDGSPITPHGFTDEHFGRLVRRVAVEKPTDAQKLSRVRRAHNALKRAVLAGDWRAAKKMAGKPKRAPGGA